MKKIFLLSFFFLIRYSGAQNTGPRYYNQIGSPMTTYYSVINKTVTQISDTAAIVSATFQAGNSNLYNQNNFCQSTPHVVKFGFWYDTSFNSIALWQYQNVNWIGARAFPLSVLSRSDTVLSFDQQYQPAFPPNGTTYSFRFHDLVPNKKYYIRWFVKDSAIGAPQGCSKPLINTQYIADSFITKPAGNWISAKTTSATNISSTGAIVTGKYIGNYKSPVLPQPLREVICWGTDPNINIASNFLTATNIKLGQQEIKANLLSYPFTMVYTYQLSGLLPSTKYYAQVAWVWTDPLDKSIQGIHVTPGNVVSFVTAPADVTNNEILTKDQVICSNSNGNFIPPVINASQPTGGSGNYQFTWQKKSILTSGWENCASSSSLLNYAPQSFSAKIDSYLVVSYRRIITDGGKTYESNPLSFTYLSRNLAIPVTVDLLGSNSNEVRLVGEPSRLISNFTAVWKISTVNNQKTTILSNSNVYTIVLDPQKKYLNNLYWVELNAGNNCPVFPSLKIQITPPDGDGNVYPAVQVGDQAWMMGNLKTTRFNDNTQIKLANTTTLNLQAAYSWYNSDSVGNVNSNGALYNIAVIQNDQGKNVCPTGWRPAGLPDWNILIGNGGGESQAGVLLRKSSGWYFNDLTASTNTFNFNAWPSGYYDNTYKNKGLLASWWGLDAGTNQASLNPAYIEITGEDKRVYVISGRSLHEISNEQRAVRCVKTNK